MARSSAPITGADRSASSGPETTKGPPPSPGDGPCRLAPAGPRCQRASVGEQGVLLLGLLGRRTLVLAVGARERDRRGVGQVDRLGLAAEGELLRRALRLVDVHHHDLARGDLAVEDLLAQSVLDLALD